MTRLACGVLILAASVASAGPLQVAHDGEVIGQQIAWQTEWRSPTLLRELPLAVSLPADARVQGALPVRDDDGRIVALEVSPPAAVGRFEVIVDQASGDVLAVPLLDDLGVQRVIVDGLAFTPDESLGFEKHIRYWAPPAIDSAGRKAFEKQWRRGGGRAARPGDQALYLRSEARMAAAGGIPGSLAPAGYVSWMVHLLLGSCLVGVLAFSGLLYRGLERQARQERNDCYIRRHLGDEEGIP